MSNGTNGDNGRIELLRQKERDIRAALAAELVKKAKREKREGEKLASIVGRVVCEQAAQDPESFGLMLKQVLDTGATNREREFLRLKGML